MRRPTFGKRAARAAGGSATDFLKSSAAPSASSQIPDSVFTRQQPESSLSRERRMKVGESLAEKSKHMTDSQWEQVSFDDKAAFTSYMKEQVRAMPANVSEQQRRRYYETTTENVRLSADQIVNPYQRLKMGLPFHLDSRGRRSTVAETMMEQADAENFDPHDARHIEYAQTHFKQAFKDYVANKKQGRSTEAERRRIAAMAVSLQHDVQRHLANMYKYADARLHDAAKEQSQRRLEGLVRAREQAERLLKETEGTVESTTSPSSPRLTKAQRLARKYGLDAQLAETMWSSMKEQEGFLERLEVLNRLTSESGAGFAHTAKDESLDEYTDRLKNVLSLDPERAACTDVVQYYAQLNQMDPADWARRWYESHLVYPLTQTPEYRRMVEISETETAAPKAREAAQERIDDIKKFSELVLVGNVSDSLQEQRMRYLAYRYMQVQIKRMRAKCFKYEHVDVTSEREEVLSLRKKMDVLGNDFTNPAVCDLHHRVMEIVESVVEKAKVQHVVKDTESAELVSKAIATGNPSIIKAEVRRLKRKKLAEQTLRMVRLLEEDVRDDVKWQSEFEDAERPAELPVPEPFLYISAADAQRYRMIEDFESKNKGSPFHKKQWDVTFMGKRLDLPTQPMLFWGTGVAAVQQALAAEAEEAAARRRSVQVAASNQPSNAGGGGSDGGTPSEFNPWGWRRNPDALD
eukprot:PhM_4_TR3085/c0_g1_i1/m.53774